MPHLKRAGRKPESTNRRLTRGRTPGILPREASRRNDTRTECSNDPETQSPPPALLGGQSGAPAALVGIGLPPTRPGTAPPGVHGREPVRHFPSAAARPLERPAVAHADRRLPGPGSKRASDAGVNRYHDRCTVAGPFRHPCLWSPDRGRPAPPSDPTPQLPGCLAGPSPLGPPVPAAIGDLRGSGRTGAGVSRPKLVRVTACSER